MNFVFFMMLYTVCNLLELLYFYVCNFSFVNLEYLGNKNGLSLNYKLGI